MYLIFSGKFSTELPEELDPHNVMQTEHLAPHGVPSSGTTLNKLISLLLSAHKHVLSSAVHDLLFPRFLSPP